MSRMRMMPENGTASRYEAMGLEYQNSGRAPRSGPVREVVGHFLGDEPDGVFERLARTKMVAREDADEDRLAAAARHLEHADIVADVRQEVARLVGDPVAADVSRNPRPV